MIVVRQTHGAFRVATDVKYATVGWRLRAHNVMRKMGSVFACRELLDGGVNTVSLDIGIMDQMDAKSATVKQTSQWEQCATWQPVSAIVNREQQGHDAINA